MDDNEKRNKLKSLQIDEEHNVVSVSLSEAVYTFSPTELAKVEEEWKQHGVEAHVEVFASDARTLYCQVGDTLYVASRGTIPTDASDLKADLTPGYRLDETGSYYVNRGFINRVEGNQRQNDEIFADMDRRLQENPDLKVVFTGHSLGGATAQLLIDKFHQRYSKHDGRTTAYLYGSPATGRKDMQQYYNENGISRRIFNIVNEKDPIPPASYHFGTVSNAVKLLVGVAAEMQLPGGSRVVEAVMGEKGGGEKTPKSVEPVGNMIILSREGDKVTYIGHWSDEERKQQLKKSYTVRSHMITGYKTAVFHTTSKPDSEEAEFTLEELQRVTRKVMRRIRRKQNVTPQDVSALLGLEKAAESSSSGDDDDKEEPLLETRPPSGGLPPTPGGAPPAPPALDTLKRTKEIEKGFHYFETRVEERLDKAAPQKVKSTVKQATAVSTAAVLGLKRTVARQEPNFAELLQQTVAARQARQQAAVLAQLAPFTEGQSREDLLRWVRRCDGASGEQTVLAESVVERAVRECFQCSEAEARALAEEELTARGDPAVTQGHAVLEDVGLRNETVLSRLTPSSRVVAQAQERMAEKEREASRRQADMETKEEEEYKKLVNALSKDPAMLQNRIADEVIEREFRVAPLQPVRRTVDLAAASLPPAAPTVWQQTEETRRHNEAQLRRLQSLAQQTDYMERERVGALLGTQPCHAPLQRDKTTTVARPVVTLAKQTVAADMQKKMETHLNVHMEQKVAQAAVFEEPLELQKAKVMQSRPGLSIQLGAHLEQAEPELPGLDDFTIPTGMSSVTAEKEMELKDLFSALHQSLVEIPAAQQFESNYTQQRQQRMQGRATVARHATMNQK